MADAGKKNLELLGLASQEDKSVTVQQPNGTFLKMTPTEARIYLEKTKNQSALARALQHFEEREKAYKREMELLHLGGCDPRGSEVIQKIIGRRS